MTMSLDFVYNKQDNSGFLLAAGYESGHACIYSVSSSHTWSKIYSFKSHIQPTLSVSIHPSQETFYSSAADANIALHPIAIATQPIKSINTKHSGQTGLSIRSDGRIFVTAGWDGSGRVYSSLTLKQVAVLKWHGSGLQVAKFSGVRQWIILGGKDGKI